MAQGQPLDRGLAGRAEAEQRQRRPEYPQRQVERAGGKNNGAAAEQLDDGAGLAALGGRQPRQPRHVRRLFGNRKPVERRPRAGFAFDPPGILGKLHEPAGAFDLHRLARRANGESRIEPAGPLGGFDHGDADALRRGDAERGIGRRGDADSDAGKTQDPGIVCLAGEITRAFARGVTDVAEDEQIADRGAGKAREIGRLAGPQPADKTPGGLGGRVVLDRRRHRPR